VLDSAMIAIIDDDEEVRVATESLVRSLGYRTTAYASAEEFLRSPRRGEADCLITDVQMPGMSGIELQERLGELRDPPPMIFITAFPEEHIRERVYAGGAVALLTKPFDCSAMIDVIGRALELCPTPSPAGRQMSRR